MTAENKRKNDMSEGKQFTIEAMDEAFAAMDEPRKTTMPIMSPHMREKIDALAQVPILPDDRFKFGGIAKWCGEDVASEEKTEHEAWREWAEQSSKIEFHARDQYAMSNPNSTKQERDEYASQVSASDEHCQRLYEAWQDILTKETK